MLSKLFGKTSCGMLLGYNLSTALASGTSTSSESQSEHSGSGSVNISILTDTPSSDGPVPFQMKFISDKAPATGTSTGTSTGTGMTIHPPGRVVARPNGESFSADDDRDDISMDGSISIITEAAEDRQEPSTGNTTDHETQPVTVPKPDSASDTMKRVPPDNENASHGHASDSEARPPTGPDDEKVSDTSGTLNAETSAANTGDVTNAGTTTSTDAGTGPGCHETLSTGSGDPTLDDLLVMRLEKSPFSGNKLGIIKKTLTRLGYEHKHRYLIVGESTFLFSKILAMGLSIVKEVKQADPTDGWTQLPSRCKRQRVDSCYEYVPLFDENGQNSIFATSYTQDVELKYGIRDKRQKNVDIIKEFDLCQVIHGVDATKLNEKEELDRQQFDRIIWTFPYNPDFHNCSDKQKMHDANWHLLRDFLKNVRPKLKPKGEIHILLNDKGLGGQYGDWGLETRLTDDFPKRDRFYLIKRPVPINFVNGVCIDFPGYVATKTNGTPWTIGMVYPKIYVLGREADYPYDKWNKSHRSKAERDAREAQERLR